MGFGQNRGEAVRKKTATSAKPSATPPTSRSKAAGASGPDDPTRAGKPMSAAAIRLRAYQKWEAAGKPDGDDARFWLEAEQELSRSE
jgi:hypothetical protein